MSFHFLKPLVATAWLSFTGLTALADPGYYVVTPYDDAGVRTIDVRYWTVRSPGEAATLWPEIGVGYGVNSRWTTEVYASFIGTLDTAQKLSSLNWQNDVLLTQGQYPFDLALHATLIRTQGYGAANVLEVGPVLQTEVGRTQLNGNVFFERTWPGDGPQRPTQLKYQWQLRHHWQPLLDVGLQGFGEPGAWDDWSARAQQSHRAGPAVFGTWRLGDGRALLYQAAYLVGSIYGTRGDMFSMRVRYAF